MWQAGGFPLEMPVLSVGETYMKPTTMLYRNLLAMETEEIIRANPVDGVVLLGGCDKTVPGLMMGATSANLPAIFVLRRPHAARQLAGRGARQRQRRVEVLGGEAGGQPRRLRVEARWRTASRARSGPA